MVKRSRARRLLFGLQGLGCPPKVKRGSWDRWVIPAGDHPVATLMAAFHAEGFDVKRCFPHLAIYYHQRGLSSREARRKASLKVDTYVDEYRRVAESMATDGYRREIAKDEIGVAIARDGTLLKASGGHHRFGLARALDLPTVTIEVRHIHVEWLRRHWPGTDKLDSLVQAAINSQAGS